MSAQKKMVKAAALAYDAKSGSAPRVKAGGHGKLAERIIEIAREAGVPIREDLALAEILCAVQPGEEIPVHTYRAVAEILAFLYELDLQKRPVRKREPGPRE